jgi:hypothetical protein
VGTVKGSLKLVSVVVCVETAVLVSVDVTTEEVRDVLV